MPEGIIRYPRLLAIDPGSNCGYAFIDIRQPVLPGLKALHSQAGIWDLTKNRFQSQGMRFLCLKKFLVEMEPDFICFEQVNFPHKSTAAAQMYWGCVSTIQTFCEEQGIEYAGVYTSDVKKRATGKGNSGKPPIIEAANSFFSIDPPLDSSEKSTNHDDNIADALWLCQIGIEQFGNVITLRNAERSAETLKKILEMPAKQPRKKKEHSDGNSAGA